ncbi:hypothetical protein ACFX15_038102 [Malus domestica]
MESTQNKPHVVVLASPGMGHVTPLLELAKRLVVDHGFHVTFLSITTDAPPAQLQLLSNPSIPSDLHVVSLPNVDVSQQANNVSVRIVLVIQETLKSLTFVLKNLQPPIKIFVFDPFRTIAHDVAADLSILTYLFLTSSASFLALAMFFPTINAVVNGDHSKIAKEILVPDCKPLLLDDLIPGVLMPELLLMSNRLPIVNGVLENTWEELEPVTLHSIRESPFFLGLPTPPVYPIGPLTKESELVTSTLESLKLVKWLDQQPACSVVYVTFGSEWTLSGKQMSELALGLELSQKRFVWVARPPNEASVSGNFFKASFNADDPASYLPKGFLDRTRGRGLVTSSWAPQVAVLSHQFVAVWPEAEEDDGKRVVGRCEVEGVVRTILDKEEGEGLRRRVRELQGTAMKALEVGGPSNGSLDRLAKEWRES